MASAWKFQDDFWFHVTFVCHCSNANHVFLCGDFNGWSTTSHQMERSSEGFSLTVLLAEGFYQYKFYVDGQWLRDERNPHQSFEHGNSVMFVHMDPKVYGLRPQWTPHRDYARPFSDGNQFQVLTPAVSPEVAAFGIVQRQVYVYLPPSYQSGDRKYPVVYAHDGQNLFSTPADRGGPPSGGWYLDAKLDEWWSKGELPEFILVGVPNSDVVCVGNRSREYCTAEYLDTSGDPFIAYLVNDVKGAVDRQFRTLPDPANTFSLGASMGGLLSFVLAMNHWDTFSCGICLSPSLWYVDKSNKSIFDLVRAQCSLWGNIPHCRVYIDSADGDGDNCYETKLMRELLVKCCWVPDKDFMYLHDRCRDRVHLQVTHSEHVWRERVDWGLKFALSRPPSTATL